jgi:uncharacterized lipoprotein YbaY
VPFGIHYSPVLLDSAQKYAVQAQVSIQGKLALENTDVFPVITQNNPTDVQVVVQPAQ